MLVDDASNEALPLVAELPAFRGLADGLAQIGAGLLALEDVLIPEEVGDSVGCRDHPANVMTPPVITSYAQPVVALAGLVDELLYAEAGYHLECEVGAVWP